MTEMKLKIWLTAFSILASTQMISLADLQWSAGDLFGGAPQDTIIDPDTGMAVAPGSLVYLIYDADGDGNGGGSDIDLATGAPIGDDILVDTAVIGETGFPGFDAGGFSSLTPIPDINALVDTTGAVDGEMGLFYIRVFNVADPTTAGTFAFGDSVDTDPTQVTSPTPSSGGVYKYTEIADDDPTDQQWNAGLIVLDRAVPEPSTFLLVILGALGLGFMRRRSKQS